MKIICGTGHRPDKCGGYDLVTFGYLVAVARVALMWHNPDEVITGMALGWDTALAQAAYELGIPYTPYVPFAGQEGTWRPEQQQLYRQLIAGAPRPAVYVCSPGYSAFKMDLRNRSMVDNSGSVLALWNGDAKGGTANCIRYAQDRGRHIANEWGRLASFRADPASAAPWQSPTFRCVA